MEWGIVGVCFVLVIVSVCDIKTRLISNKAIMVLLVLKLAAQLGECSELNYSLMIDSMLASLFGSIVRSLIVIACLLALSLIAEKLIGKPSLGMGDVKLIGALVLFLPGDRILSFLWVACLAMMATALFYAVRKKKTFPCAPAISIGFFAEVLFRFAF